MEKEITETRRVPVKTAYDLIVTGGGIAGISAALAGGRQGLKTLLIEKSAVLGGLATLGLINWYEPLCDGEGRIMVRGIAEELLKLSIAYGYDNLPRQWLQDTEPKEDPRKRYATLFNPAVFSLALNELVLKESIELRYDMLASYPVMEGTLCKGVITESKNGREYFPARVVIDATGDADIMSRAGVPCREGLNYFTYIAHGCTLASIEKALRAGDMTALNAREFGIGSDLNGSGHPKGLHFFAGISNEGQSEYIQLGQTMLLDRIRTKPKNETCLYSLPGMVQLRKTRCIIGMETFTGEDGKSFENSIGTAGDFRTAGKHYEIPMGVLFNGAFPNLLAAGRIVSAEGDGWEISRVIPTAALTGEAAGVIASLLIKQDKSPGDLNIEQVRRILKPEVLSAI